MSSAQVSNVPRTNLEEAPIPPKTSSSRGNFKSQKHITFQLATDTGTPKKSKSPGKLKMSDNKIENEDDQWSSTHEVEDQPMTASNNNQQQPQKWKKLFRKHKVAILEMLRDSEGKQDGGRLEENLIINLFPINADGLLPVDNERMDKEMNEGEVFARFKLYPLNKKLSSIK